ncbi:hypothetical protein BH24CHL6_BH24CHL6_08580 [soil metagenome]
MAMRLFRQRGANLASIACVIVLTIAGVHIGVAQYSTDRHEKSDAFWNALWVRATEAEHYWSWQELALSADVVVVGKIKDARYGRARGTDFSDPELLVHFGHLVVAPEEIFAGAHGISPSGIVIEMMLPSGKALDAIERYEPGERVLLFLRDKHAVAIQEGLPQESVEMEAGYYSLVQQDAIVRAIDGKAHPRSHAATDVFTDWDGASFTDLTHAVRQLLVSAGDP